MSEPQVAIEQQNQQECGSVTLWLRAFKSGDDHVLHSILNRYYEKVTRSARRFFGKKPRMVFDEEDVASIVFQAVFTSENLADVNDREALIKLLLVAARNKVIDINRQVMADKRGNGRVRALSDLKEPIQKQLANLQNKYSDPQIEAALKESIQVFMKALDNDVLREIARKRMQGHTVESIATGIGQHEKAIERKLRLIRSVWLDCVGGE